MPTSDLEQLAQFLRGESNTDKKGVWFVGNATLQAEGPFQFEARGALRLEEVLGGGYTLYTGQPRAGSSLSFKPASKPSDIVHNGEYVRVPIEMGREELGLIICVESINHWY